MYLYSLTEECNVFVAQVEVEKISGDTKCRSVRVLYWSPSMERWVCDDIANMEPPME